MALDVVMAAGKKLYLDGGGNTYITELSADRFQVVVNGTVAIDIRDDQDSIALLNADVDMTAAKKLYLDGGGNTYIHEASPDRFQLVVGAAVAIDVENIQDRMGLVNANIYMTSGKQFSLGDAGGDTYFVENSTNVFRCVAGGSGGVDLLSGGTSWTLFASLPARFTMKAAQRAWLAKDMSMT